MKYTKTVFVSSVAELPALKIGQWFTNETGSRGQYLGITKTGAHVVRWQAKDKFGKIDARANKPLRQFAKIYGEVI